MKAIRRPTEVKVGNHMFYIIPFGAMTASEIFGDLVSFASPLITSLISMFDFDGENEDSILDMSIDKAAPSVTSAFRSVTGKDFRRLIKLLILNDNISVEVEDQRVERLDENLMDELFIGNIQDIFLLAWEVMKLNYSGFFSSLSGLFGNQKSLGSLVSGLKNTDPSMLQDLVNSN